MQHLTFNLLPEFIVHSLVIAASMRSEEDEMEGEQEYFMRLDVFVKKFGQRAKDKIVSLVGIGNSFQVLLCYVFALWMELCLNGKFIR